MFLKTPRSIASYIAASELKNPEFVRTATVDKQTLARCLHVVPPNKLFL
jgi:hypothetical protein